MELHEFTAIVPGFANLSQPDQILHFAWYLHTHREKGTFDQAAIRSCYKERHMDEPNISKLFTRLLERRPKVLLSSGAGFQLEHKIREQFEAKYGQHQTTIAVSKGVALMLDKLA